MDFRSLITLSLLILLSIAVSSGVANDNSHILVSTTNWKISRTAYEGKITISDGKDLNDQGAPSYPAQLLDIPCNHHMNVAFYGGSGSWRTSYRSAVSYSNETREFHRVGGG